MSAESFKAKGEEILKNMMAALKGLTLYPPKHPSVSKPIKELYGLISGHLSVDHKLTFSVIEGVMVVSGEPYYDTVLPAREMMERFEEKKLSNVDFMKGVTEEEVKDFLEILNMESAALEAKGGVAGELANRNVTRIVLKSAKQVYNKAVDTVKGLLHEARLGKIPNSDKAIQMINEITEKVIEEKPAMLGLTMIKNYDEYLFNHSVNVSVLSISLAESVDVPKEDLQDIGLAGLLHDIGKTATPIEIIRKPGKLNPEEWEAMKMHPVKSAEIARKMKGISELTSRLIYEHHVNYDMKGYPKLPEGQGIHPYTKIIEVADCYDAMTTLRPYQKQFTPKEALEIMQNIVGKVVDPQYYESFVRMIGIYPIGTLVRLDNNEIALIMEAKVEDELKPKIKIILDRDGNHLPRPLVIDLESDGRGSAVGPVKIVSTVDPLLLNVDIAEYF